MNYSLFDEAMEQRREDDSLQEMLDQGTSPLLVSHTSWAPMESPLVQESPAFVQLSPMQSSYREPSIQLSPMQSNVTHSCEQPPVLQPHKTNVHYTSAANQSNIVTNLLDLTGKSKTAGRQGVKRKYVQYDKPSIYQHTLDWDVLEGDLGADDKESEPEETDEATGGPAEATAGWAEEEWLPGASKGPKVVTEKPTEAPAEAPGGPAGATGVKPVLAKVLRFKTKSFMTPMNLQYIGMFNEKMLISDSQNYIAVSLSPNYQSIVKELNINTIITIFQVTRSGINMKDVSIINMSVANSKQQTNNKLGSPKLLALYP